MPPVVGIQFSPVGKQYHFDAKGITDLQPGDRVVVNTSRGKQLGIVIDYVPDEELEGRACKPIERRATPRDLVMQQQWQAKALSAVVTCAEKAEELGLQGYKFIQAEYNFDGTQVTILYTAEKKRGDLGELQRELRRMLRTRVELYQAGPRDLAKTLDGLGACGIPRCCSRFLTRFSSVSIRMAKAQNISLTPSEITGVCGRLRCCLAYEYEQYVEAAEGLPRRGKEVVTPYGKGRVVEVRTLAGDTVVDVEGVRYVVGREDLGKQEFTNPPREREVYLPDWLDDSSSAEDVSTEEPGDGKPERPSRRRGGRSKGKRDSRGAAPQPPKPRHGERGSRRRPRRSKEKKE
jgi:cell fate regulator YaaT (PSP1 superfamily)